MDHALRIFFREKKNFSLVKKIGEGTYGQVHVIQNEQHTNIALKTSYFDSSSKFTSENDIFNLISMKRELVALKHLNHPCIVSLYFHEYRENLDFFSLHLGLELMSTNLYQTIECNTFTLSTISYIVWQLCHGLSFIHSHGIVHRDFTSSNILIDNQCNIKIADFGFARRIPFSYENVENFNLTMDVCTAFFRAPELFYESKTMYSFGVDVWSLGCIIMNILDKGSFMFQSSCEHLNVEGLNANVWAKIVHTIKYFPSASADWINDQFEMEDTNEIFHTARSQNKIHYFYNYLDQEKYNDIFETNKNIIQYFASFLEKVLVFDPTERFHIDDLLFEPLVLHAEKFTSFKQREILNLPEIIPVSFDFGDENETNEKQQIKNFCQENVQENV
jgi:serine/threonine protein kinase